MSKRVQELDALRGIACLSVFLFHLSLNNDKQGNHFQFSFGVTGVDLFFIISGYVIFMSVTRVKDWREFLINRFARLYPTYWLCLTITFLITIYKTGTLSTIKQYLANLSMLQYYLRIPDLDGVYWTLTVELIFYLAIAFLLRYQLLQKIELIGVGGLLCCLFYSFLSKDLSKILFYLLDYTLLVKHFPLFFAGILFFKIQNDKLNLGRIIMMVMCFLVQLSLFYMGGKSQFFITFYEYLTILIIYFSIFFLLIAGKLKIISNDKILLLGAISYPFYLLHDQLCIQIFIPFFMKVTHLNFWIAGGLSFLIVSLIAFLVTSYFEPVIIKKVRDTLKSWLKSPDPILK